MHTHHTQKKNSPEEVAEQVGKLIVDVGFGYVQSAALGCVYTQCGWRGGIGKRCYLWS